MKERRSILGKVVFLEMTLGEIIIVSIGMCLAVALYRGYDLPANLW